RKPLVKISRLVIGDELVLRDIRLRALADSPSAYGSSLELEVALTDADWRNRLARIDAATFIARDGDGTAIGLVTGMIDDDFANVGWLLSMWVEPTKRGNGVAGQLIDEVLAWSREQNCTSLLLQVTEGNTSALRTYEKRGFRQTGTTVLRERDNMAETGMELIL
ncbi:MAG: GNAT family N-acetyltransferase, partial [Ilumatobacteraceae bacterium]